MKMSHLVTRGHLPSAVLSMLPLIAPACGITPEPEAPGKRFEISVAPLELATVDDAEFTITVHNGDTPPDVVWTASGLRSDRYGDGRGSLTYVGPCDASTPFNTVTLELDALFTTAAGELVAIPPSEWRNPTPVSLTAPCDPNRDTPVVFNLVIMRDADQGFFDVAVNFSDVFCSAKLDCSRQLLFDGPSRALTFITGFACATGEGENTWLYLDDFRLECSDDDWQSIAVTIPIDPDQSGGQHGPLGAGAIYQHAIYAGQEDFPEIDKCYWNTAIGVSETWLSSQSRCRISGAGTAATEQWPGFTSPGHTAYPRIGWSAEIWNAGQGGLVCRNHPLDGSPAGVSTTYTDLSLATGTPFQHARPCSSDKIACVVRDQDITVEGAPGGRTLTISAGGVSGSFTLPADRTLGALDGCCDGCCQDAPQDPCAGIELALANCPTEAVEVCDVATGNDTTLYNAGSAWDPVLLSSDLFEAPASLGLQVITAPSNTPIFGYALTLDLDGDGAPETAALGGTPPYSPGQGWAFGMTTSPDGLSAAVRWVKDGTPSATPELPYGTHAMSWSVSDACGHQLTCAHDVVVRDCKKPTPMCTNGMSAVIMQSGQITLLATDFDIGSLDNYTPADRLRFAIRRGEGGTAPPLDPQGELIESLDFTCADVGQVPVEIWVVDLAGNADACFTSVLIQDSLGVCDP